MPTFEKRVQAGADIAPSRHGVPIRCEEKVIKRPDDDPRRRHTEDDRRSKPQ